MKGFRRNSSLILLAVLMTMPLTGSFAHNFKVEKSLTAGGQICNISEGYQTSKITMDLNLDSRSQLVGGAFDKDNKLTFNHLVFLHLFGNNTDHHLAVYFIKTNTNYWVAKAILDNQTDIATAVLTFDSSGELTNIDGFDSIPLENSNFKIDMRRTTQYASDMKKMQIRVDGRDAIQCLNSKGEREV